MTDENREKVMNLLHSMAKIQQAIKDEHDRHSCTMLGYDIKLADIRLEILGVIGEDE